SPPGSCLLIKCLGQEPALLSHLGRGAINRPDSTRQSSSPLPRRERGEKLAGLAGLYRISHQPKQGYPPFRKGGRGGISAEHPERFGISSVACCGMLAAWEYAPIKISVSTNFICPNPPISPFTKGGEDRA